MLDTFILRLRRGEREERPVGGKDMGFTDFFFGEANNAAQNRITAAPTKYVTSLKYKITNWISGTIMNHNMTDDEDISLQLVYEESEKFIQIYLWE